MIVEWTKTATGEATSPKDVPDGAVIVAVDGKECIGSCEACSAPICDGEDHDASPEGELVCSKCRPD